MSRPRLRLLPILVLVTACGPTTRTMEIVSDVYTVDRLYRSMQGPAATVDVQLPSEPVELVWITGYRADVVAADGVTPLAPEFMCHSNLGLTDVPRHARLFGWSKLPARRLFTVSQGQDSVRLPDGFGIPILTSERLSLTTQVLNHNWPDTLVQARVRVTIDYVRDRDVRREMTPLYMKSANALVRMSDHDGHFGMADPPVSGEVGAAAGAPAGERMIEDGFGREFAGHWVVPPGRQENVTNVTHWMNLSGDATVHFIAVHVHPFAESLSLRTTRGSNIFTSTMQRFPDRIGLAVVPVLSTREGVTLSADEEFELVSAYHNTSDDDQEAMAVMYLYLRDDEFRNPFGR